jgi:hypothetical protein
MNLSAGRRIQWTLVLFNHIHGPNLRRWEIHNAHRNCLPSVKDTEHWLASPMRKKFFGFLGVTGIRELIDPQNATRVAVLTEVANLDAVKAAMKNSRGR